MESYTKKVEQTFVLREPAIKSAIRTLQFVPNSHGLDIGCGIVNITGLLAESIAPRGHVTGIDISPEMVAIARDPAEKAGLIKQLSFRLADMKSLFQMRWPGVRQELSNDDWIEFQRLCHPDSAEYILNALDYYGFFMQSLFQGKVPL